MPITLTAASKGKGKAYNEKKEQAWRRLWIGQTKLDALVQSLINARGSHARMVPLEGERDAPWSKVDKYGKRGRNGAEMWAGEGTMGQKDRIAH